MPRFDGTGPWSFGPGAGWGLGPCGTGLAWRRGRGFGWHWAPYQSLGGKEEKEALKEELKDLEDEMAQIKERLSQLKDK